MRSTDEDFGELNNLPFPNLGSTTIAGSAFLASSNPNRARPRSRSVDAALIWSAQRIDCWTAVCRFSPPLAAVSSAVLVDPQADTLPRAAPHDLADAVVELDGEDDGGTADRATATHASGSAGGHVSRRQ